MPHYGTAARAAANGADSHTLPSGRPTTPHGQGGGVAPPRPAPWKYGSPPKGLLTIVNGCTFAAHKFPTHRAQQPRFSGHKTAVRSRAQTLAGAFDPGSEGPRRVANGCVWPPAPLTSGPRTAPRAHGHRSRIATLTNCSAADWCARDGPRLVGRPTRCAACRFERLAAPLGEPMTKCTPLPLPQRRRPLTPWQTPGNVCSHQVQTSHRIRSAPLWPDIVAKVEKSGMAKIDVKAGVRGKRRS
jgi:hypothetical protein